MADGTEPTAPRDVPELSLAAAGPWPYGGAMIRLLAYLIDSNHNHSNTLDYQINCAG